MEGVKDLQRKDNLNLYRLIINDDECKLYSYKHYKVNEKNGVSYSTYLDDKNVKIFDKSELDKFLSFYTELNIETFTIEEMKYLDRIINGRNN